MADKHKRIGTLVLRNVTDIIRKELDYEIVSLSSINEIKMNRDNSLATLYVTHLVKEQTKPLIEYLNSKKGFIRQRLGKMMSIYKVPDLVFVEDDLYDKGARIDDILRGIYNK